MFRVLVLAILLIISKLSFAQADIDSLNKIAKSATGDSIAIIYNQIGIQLCYSDPAKSLDYLQKAFQSAKIHNNYKQQCIACSFMGTSNRYLGNYNVAIQHYTTQLDIAIENYVIDEVVWASINLGNVMIYMSNYELANSYLERALMIANNAGDENLLQYVYVNLGRVNLLSHNYQQSLLWHHKTLEIRKKFPENAINIVVTYRDISSAHLGNKDYDSSKFYCIKGLQILDTLPYNAVSSSINTNLAKIYLHNNNLDSANICATKALQCAQHFQNKDMLREACLVMGDIKYKLADYQQAENYYRMQISYNNELRTSDVQRQIFNIQSKNEQYEQSQQIANENRQKIRQIRMLIAVIIAVISGITIAIILLLKFRRIKNMNQLLNFQTEQLQLSNDYACKIQNSILPNFDNIGKIFSDKFIIFKPKELVSGDYYWHHDSGDLEMFAVASSGSTGVPGGLMSMLGASILHGIASEETFPSTVLNKLNENSGKWFSDNTSKMYYNSLDISLLTINNKEKCIYFSGLKNPLIYVRNGKVCVLQNNSKDDTVTTKKFVTDKLDLENDDRIYALTGGFYRHQGKDGSIFTLKKLTEIIEKIYQFPMDEQKDYLLKALKDFNGGLQFNEDITMAGFVFWGGKND